MLDVHSTVIFVDVGRAARVNWEKIRLHRARGMPAQGKAGQGRAGQGGAGRCSAGHCTAGQDRCQHKAKSRAR